MQRCPPPSTSKRFVAITVLPVLIALGCGNANAESQSIAGLRPESVAAASASAYYFDSVAAMAATADLVVEATVVDVQRGRQYGKEDGDVGLGLRDVQLEVSSALKGQAPQTIWIEEDGFDRMNQPFEIDGNPWSLIGDKGFYFLIKSGSEQPEDHYFVLNADGRILFEDGRTVTFGSSTMSGNLRSLEPQKVRGLINAGVQQAAHDRMPPQVPWSATERPSVDVPTGAAGCHIRNR